jgi:hypothetical protein
MVFADKFLPKKSFCDYRTAGLFKFINRGYRTSVFKQPEENHLHNTPGVYPSLLIAAKTHAIPPGVGHAY